MREELKIERRTPAWTTLVGLDADAAHRMSSDKNGRFSMHVADPVCGMSLEVDKAAGHEDYRGWAYFFCSARCHQLFTANPEQYVRRKQPSASPLAAAAVKEAGSHG